MRQGGGFNPKKDREMPNLIKPQDSQLKPAMLSLVKKADTALAKYNLTGHTAAVAIIIDYSGSMDHLYEDGQVQRLVERFVALGHRFDDDGAIDLYAYHHGAEYIGQLTALDCGNVLGRIEAIMGPMGSTDYAEGIAKYRKRTFGSDGERKAPLAGKQPHYVAFITDGRNGGSNRECVDQFRSSSYEPVFIQCIALGADYDPKASSGGIMGRMFGGGNTPPAEFAFLAKLDSEITGRLVDNAGFFSTKSPDALSDEAFLDRMMGEYPDWWKLAKGAGLIA